MRQKNLFLLCSLLILITLTPIIFVNANLWDLITGKATQPTNVSITVSSIVVDWVSTIPDDNVTEGSTTSIAFYFTASIPGGAVADINDSTARANFTRAGEDTRENSSCDWVSDIDADTANYSCTIDVWYWDEAGAWNITAAIADINDNWVKNDSTTFTLLETTAFVASPSVLNWGTIKPGDSNQTSDNDPSLLNNTANKPIASGNISIRALDLHGEDNATYFIDSINFTSDIDTGGDAECDGTALSNNSFINITGASLPKGNNTAGSGQEQLYYCLTEVDGGLAAQAYSTSLLGSWTIQIL